MRAVTSTAGQSTSTQPTSPEIEIPQYSRPKIFALWAAAAVPMAVMARVVGPAVAGGGASKDRFFVVLLSALTLGLL